jgi:chemotaxis protein CheD
MAVAHPPVTIYLQPGDYFVGDADCRIRTLLGSCVSVTLWHPQRRVGAMSHFLLPTRGAPCAQPDGRYGDEAVLLMLRELRRLGVDSAECKAKIFGGADMFPGCDKAAAMRVGKRNGEAARALLRAHGIEVVSHSLYGNGYRQIVFEVHSGDVWARQVPVAPDPAQDLS